MLGRKLSKNEVGGGTQPCSFQEGVMGKASQKAQIMGMEEKEPLGKYFYAQQHLCDSVFMAQNMQSKTMTHPPAHVFLLA